MNIIFLALSVLTVATAMANTESKIGVEADLSHRLKMKIVEMAERNSGQIDTEDRRLQRELEVVIREFMKLQPESTYEEKALRALGAWRQIWGPYEFDGRTGEIPAGLDTDEIYQVIDEAGFYYNFARFRLYRTGGRDRFLPTYARGVYELTESDTRVQFTSFGAFRHPQTQPMPFWYTHIEYLKWPVVLLGWPSSWKFRIGPIGAKGVLKEVFADDRIRINYGYELGSDRELAPSLFILERVDLEE